MGYSNVLKSKPKGYSDGDWENDPVEGTRNQPSFDEAVKEIGFASIKLGKQSQEDSGLSDSEWEDYQNWLLTVKGKAV